MTDKLSAAIQIAEQIHLLAQEQNDAALMIGASSCLACTLYYLGHFESARRHASHGVQIWRSGGVQSSAEDFHTPVVGCLCYLSLSEWHLGEIISCRAAMEEAISLAKELGDTNTFALALHWAANLAYLERSPAEVDRLVRDLIQLSTRHNLVYFLTVGAIHRGWVRSASGETAEGIPWIEQGISDFRATGSVLALPYYLALKAEALHLADRTSEALAAIDEAEAVSEGLERRDYCAELRRFRGVFLAALGAEETQIEASFREAIKIAKEQRSISLTNRAEATYAEYRRQKEASLGRRRFGLPL
jgi:predicted ATPase